MMVMIGWSVAAAIILVNGFKRGREPGNSRIKITSMFLSAHSGATEHG
jgi:hypothetical protein